VTEMAGDILIIAEHREGKLNPTTLELVTLGRALASQTGGGVKVALFGSGVDGLASQLAAHAEILLVQHPLLQAYSPGGYVQALQAVRGSVEPRVVLLPHDPQGYDLAPALAAAWQSPIVTNCVDLSVEGSALVATRKVLNEKIVVEVEVASDRPFVVTVRPATVKASAPLASPAPIAKADVSIDGAKLGATFVRYETPQVQDIDITAADIVVSAGRGIKDKKNLPLVEEFAKLLGGVVGASRPLTDLEWLPKTRQVGQSGKTVRPKLYVACGISGAMQHVSGMKDSGTIIAVNTDPTAPIFEIAHYGFTANVLELLPAVIKELKGG
jgi:electron transfer flavoprotein alpha subunit